MLLRPSALGVVSRTLLGCVFEPKCRISRAPAAGHGENAEKITQAVAENVKTAVDKGTGHG
jgi:hypothetical protein